MYKMVEKYEDYNGVERTEEFYFHLNKAELIELQTSFSGGLAETIDKITKTNDQKTLVQIFKDLVLKAYGEKSVDGRRFSKVDDNGRPLYYSFMETEAYPQIFMKLATDAKEAANFVNGIVPKDLADAAAEEMKKNPTLAVLN